MVPGSSSSSDLLRGFLVFPSNRLSQRERSTLKPNLGCRTPELGCVRIGAGLLSRVNSVVLHGLS